MILINGGFVFNAIYSVVKGFIHERTRAKFVFPSGSDYMRTLLEKIDISQIPSNYGGTGRNLDDMVI